MPNILLILTLGTVGLLLVSVWLYSRVARNRRHLAESNAALAARLRMLEDFMAEAVVVADAAGLIVGIDHKVEQRFGYPAEAVIGKDIRSFMPEFPTFEASRGVVAVQLADGSRKTFGFNRRLSEERLNYLFFDEGHPVAVEALREPPALEVVESVVSRIVRQLEGLLTVVNGYTELALQGCGAETAIRKDLEEIATASDAASRLVLHLLAFSGNQLIPVEPLDLNAMLESLQRKLPGVQMEFCAEDLFVQANAECLSYVVQLFSGSAQYRVGEAVPVQIVVSRRKIDTADYAAIAISDAGPALTPTTLAHLFEPLFLDREGVGVDLSAIYGMVRTLGGKITVVSEAPRGTAFEILLPLMDMNPVKGVKPGRPRVKSNVTAGQPE